MSNLIITAGSVTSAVRLEKRLNSAGIIHSTVIHTPPAVSTQGCSYSVRVPYKYYDLVRELSTEKRIKYKKIYIEDIIDGESVYSAIS